MGQCYAIKLKVKSKDEPKTVSLLKEFIATPGINFNIDKFKNEGVGTDTVDDLIRIIFAGYKKHSFETERQKNGFKIFTNAFECCYGWERVMIDAFKKIAPTLENKSVLWIWPDNDYDKCIVQDGQFVFVH